jgi:RNA polymerase sigma-70 factor, ECF subfamily
VTDPTSDEILMAAYQAGSGQAFEALFERHASSVYGFLVRRVGDEALAEDLYQEAFLRVHRARHTYEAGRPFRAWLFAIAHNLLNDSLRSRARTPQTRSLDDAPETERRSAKQGSPARAIDLEPSQVPPDGSPEALAANHELGHAVTRAVRALPADEATVLLLARFEGLSYEDIGPIVGRTPAAAKQLVYRALKRVRAELAASGFREET